MANLFAILKALSAVAGAVKQFFAFIAAKAQRQAGRDEQRVENLEEAERKHRDAEAELRKLEGGGEDVRNDL
jgi:hypothetical protein